MQRQDVFFVRPPGEQHRVVPRESGQLSDVPSESGGHGLRQQVLDLDAVPRALPVLAGSHEDRPNHLGVTVCRLVAVEGLEIKVTGLDAIDGTPVLDIKPVMREFLPRGEVVQPAWASELMQGYWKT